MHFHTSNIHLPTRKNQTSFKSTKDIIKGKDSIQGQNEEQRPSHLSTRSKSRTTTLSSQYKVKIKNNDPLVSVQGQNQEQRPSRLNTRSKSRTMTFSSQYKVKIKNDDTLVSVQGQNQEKRPSRLSTRSVQIQNLQPSLSQYKVSLRFATLSSQYKVSASIYTFISYLLLR